MQAFLASVLLLAPAQTGIEGPTSAEQVFENPADMPLQGKLDELVFARLSQAGIQPAAVCSDAVFVRRAFLDVIGTLPTADEVRQFLLDQNPDKRRLLIDRLLERSEFADYWAMKWGDLLRVKAEFPINLWPNAAQAYHRWIHTCIRDNLPYDKFVRGLLTSNGSNFRVGPVNFYRAVQSKTPEGIAQAVALTWMGVRTDDWPAERLSGMAAFFSEITYKETAEWKEEIVAFDPDKASQSGPASARTATFPDGSTIVLTSEHDPRAIFADWLISPKNPWFCRNIVNRVWAWLLGRGIIHEPDDVRPDNPPANPELLAYLEHELIAARYDLKRIYRLILHSKTYQLSSIARSDSPDAARLFAVYPLRRLDAEVLIDALNQITGTTEAYSSSIPEPFTFVPADQRAIGLPDGSITSAFLEQFGRPSRDTGLESERSNRPTVDQRLHLLNSSHIQRKIESGPALQAIFQSAVGQPPAKRNKARRSAAVDEDVQHGRDQVANTLYLTILSRFPTPDELRAASEYAQKAGSRREAAVDLAWALINSAEFLYRH